jgi:glycosyltransferase involved in cell wall biosynthesis
MTEHTPAITVIIPTYNSSGTLKMALATVLCQDFVDFEVWVVGDGCTDDSETVVASFGDDRVHWMNLPSNSGNPCMPRNEALRIAKGKCVAYLGHDDLWFPWHLSELMDCIERTDSDFAFSLGLLLGPEGVAGTFTLPDKAWDSRKYMSPSNWLHRKGLIEVIGAWSPPVGKLGDDAYFLERVLAANVRLGFRRQFSVLKFPSALWKMYSLTSNFPQASYVEGIHQNAAGLRVELLTELAIYVAQQGLGIPKSVSRLPKPVGALIGWAFDTYGRHRWPVNNVLYQRWRKSAGLSGKKRMPN